MVGSHRAAYHRVFSALDNRHHSDVSFPSTVTRLLEQPYIHDKSNDIECVTWCSHLIETKMRIGSDGTGRD